MYLAAWGAVADRADGLVDERDARDGRGGLALRQVKPDPSALDSDIDVRAAAPGATLNSARTISATDSDVLDGCALSGAAVCADRRRVPRADFDVHAAEHLVHIYVFVDGVVQVDHGAAEAVLRIRARRYAQRRPFLGL